MSEATLLTLPNELLLFVGETLGPKDLNSLILSNRRLATLYTPLLHDLACEDKDSQPALYWAAHRGHLPLIRLLLKRGLDVNDIESVRSHNLRRVCLQAKTDPSSYRTFGLHDSPLNQAVRLRNLDIVKILIEEGGACVNTIGITGDPLFIAIYEKSDEAILRMLLEKGADINKATLPRERLLSIIEEKWKSMDIYDLLISKLSSV